jgi:hypothetical protein
MHTTKKEKNKLRNKNTASGRSNNNKTTAKTTPKIQTLQKRCFKKRILHKRHHSKDNLHSQNNNGLPHSHYQAEAIKVIPLIFTSARI